RSVEGELPRGHPDMFVPAPRAGGPAQGYAVTAEIRRRSGGAFDLPEGTVYPVLHRLEQKGLLGSRWTRAETGRERRVYSLTRSGHRALPHPQALWRPLTAPNRRPVRGAPRPGPAP